MMRLFKILTAATLVCLAAACKKEKDPVKVQSVSLDKTNIELVVGQAETLSATILPEDADDKNVTWASSDPSIVAVSNGIITAVKAGEAAITAWAGGLSAECTVSAFYDYPAVDLGLGVKWASWNVGAQDENGPGSYFAWGETTEKENYDWSKEGDYKWGIYNSSASPLYGMTKYTTDVEGGDGLEILQPGDDPATVNWGIRWRTPTIDEIKELFDETKCEWTWDSERNGYTIKGLATGNSIFLSAAGCRDSESINNAGTDGYYWSSSVLESSPNHAYSFYFYSDEHFWENDSRYYGQSVRAVIDK